MNITDEQGVRWLLLKAYEAGFRYMEMDECRQIFLYEGISSKSKTSWSSNGIRCDGLANYLKKIVKPLVSWEDEESFDIGKYLGIVDWVNVPVDTKVLVSNNCTNWKKRYFKYYDKNTKEFVCFCNGHTSWSREVMDDGYSWAYCKLAEDE